jgi:hypothetical protein
MNVLACPHHTGPELIIDKQPGSGDDQGMHEIRSILAPLMVRRTNVLPVWLCSRGPVD